MLRASYPLFGRRAGCREQGDVGRDSRRPTRLLVAATSHKVWLIMPLIDVVTISATGRSRGAGTVRINAADSWRSPGPPEWWAAAHNSTADAKGAADSSVLDCARVRPFYPQVLGDKPAADVQCKWSCSAATPRSHRRYIFIGGPPLHGTTALYGLLSSSRRVANYCTGSDASGSQCEGSYPTLRAHKQDRGAWDARWAELYNMSRLLRRYHEHWDPRKCTQMEKSPVNMVRSLSPPRLSAHTNAFVHS